MRARKLITLLVALPVLTYAGVKGYLWYSLDKTVKHVQAELAPYAEVSYRELQTSVLSPIGVSGITIKPHGVDDVIRIGSIIAKWDEPREIIPILESFYKNSLPLSLKLTVNQLSVSLDGELADKFDQAEKQPSFVPVNLPASIWGCGKGRFSASDLKAMGYERLDITGRLEYSYSKINNTLSFFARARNPDMTTVSIEGQVPTGSDYLNVGSILSVTPELANFSLAIDDESYNKKKLDYCAKKFGESEERFLAGFLQQITSDLKQYKLAPSDNLTQAFENFLKGPVRIALNFDPYAPTSFDSLIELDAESFAETLGLEVLAGDRPVGELFVPVKLEGTAAEDNGEFVQKEEQFNETPMVELDQYISKLARVKTNDGHTHYAYIEEVRPEKLVLTRHLVGGSASFLLSYAEIAEVSVLY